MANNEIFMSFLPFISVFFIISLFAIITIIAKAVFIVHQAEVVIIERLGSYHRILRSGVNFIIPFVDVPREVIWTFTRSDANRRYYRYQKQMKRIDLREAVYDFPKQNVITKDNVTMEINALLYYQITDPFASIYEVADLAEAIEKLTQTTLRNVIGSLDLDETLTSRDGINEKLRMILDEATDKWGVKVNRVELQEVNPPEDIKVAMEKQMRAERDRRAIILEAEGKKKSATLEAEGAREARITRAQGESDSRRLIAQGEADAIRIVKEAVPEANPLPYMIALNYLKTLPEITKDKQGKVIMLPYESSALMGSLGSIKELFKATTK